MISLPVDRSVYAGYASFGDHGVQKVIFPGISVKGRVQGSFFYLVVLSGCCGLAEMERRRYAYVFGFENYKVLLNGKYRKLHKALHN